MSNQQCTATWAANEVRALREGMLKHALETAASGRWSKKSQSATESNLWLQSDDRTQPFGFHACCSAAGVEPGAMRELFYSFLQRKAI